MLKSSASSTKTWMKLTPSSPGSRLVAVASMLLLSACSTVQVECPRLPPELMKRPPPLKDLQMTGQSSTPQTSTQPQRSLSAEPSTQRSQTN